jgi:Subtilase family/PA domain
MIELPRRGVALAVTAVVAAVLASVAVAGAGPTGAQNQFAGIDTSNVPAPLGLRGGSVEVVATLDDPSVAAAAQERGLTAAQQRQYDNTLEAKQDALSAQAASLGAKELGSVTTALNGVAFRVSSSRVDELRALPGVSAVRAIGQYELDLSETVPYIGAAAAHAAGVDGTGIDVAVLDSGIDYTHENMGGGGTLADYHAAYGTQVTDPLNTTRDGLFPTAKVVEGFDFVGEFWPGLKPGTPAGTPAVLHPDPDPIDCGPAVIPPSPDPAPPAPPVPNCAGGHGSHVSDIILGIGPNKGVAHGSKLFSYKVCSATTTSCSGVAILQGVDAALDPNGDGSIADRVDVINLSLGLSYGQIEDDLGHSLANAIDAGAVVVASAGNSADRPYITGSPSSRPEVISVAQTQVPSSKLFLIDPAAAGFRTVGGSRQLWSAAPTLVTGELAYNTGSLAKKQGCNANGSSPYAANEHLGDILLVDRGSCNVSLKATNAAAAGAIAVVIGNNLLQGPGDLPPDFSFGGGAQPIAAYTITLRDANHLRGNSETATCPAATGCANPAATSAIGQPATIDPASAASLVQNMVASSSRGPNHSFNAIKPDIGAPGASLSIDAGTGTGETAFGGTSGAAPMVSGSAALLLDKSSGLSPGEVKSLLMNTAETNIGLNPVGLPGVLAPISRIGGGEVRVNGALASGTAAWGDLDTGAGLSFGYQAVSGTERLRKRVTVKNYGSTTRTYSISTGFRYANDAASGAIDIDTPSSIRVRPGQTKRFDVRLRIDASKLPVWTLNGGALGGDGFRLQDHEFDGYITVNGGTNNTVHLAWHVLPHRAAGLEADDDTFKLKKNGTASVEVENDSRVLDGRVDVFSLTGTSDRIDEDDLPNPGDAFAVIDLRAVGVRLNGSSVEFAFDTFGSRSHPVYPAEFDVFIDTNRDGTDDFIVFNAENGAFATSGQSAWFAQNLATGAITAANFTDVDLNSGNVIYSGIPLAAVGLTPTTKFDFSVLAGDNYFTGLITDAIENMTYTLGTPKFTGTGLPAAIPARGEADLNIASVAGGDLASPSQTGFLLMYRDAEGVTRFNSRNEADTLEVKTKKQKKDDDD